MQKDKDPYILTGDLIEFAPKNLPGRLIRRKTGEPVSHSSIAVRMFVSGELSDAYVWESDSAGLHPALLSSRIAETDGEVYWYPLHKDLRAFSNLFFAGAKTMSGRRYDWTGVARNLFGPVPIGDGAVYCSEAVQLIAIKALLAIPEDQRRKGYMLMLSHLLNGGFGLLPGQLHRTGVWGDPILIN